jgi:hypothetical protein
MASKMGTLCTTAAMVPTRPPTPRSRNIVEHTIQQGRVVETRPIQRRPLDGSGRHGRKMGVSWHAFLLERTACQTPIFNDGGRPPIQWLRLVKTTTAASSDRMLDNVSTPRNRGWGTMAAVVHSFPIP